jgi:hypothetical protein
MNALHGVAAARLPPRPIRIAFLALALIACGSRSGVKPMPDAADGDLTDAGRLPPTDLSVDARADRTPGRDAPAARRDAAEERPPNVRPDAAPPPPAASDYAVFWTAPHRCGGLKIPVEQSRVWRIDGCNAVRLYQIPDSPGLYLQRFISTLRDPANVCSPSSWGVRLTQRNDRDLRFVAGDWVLRPPQDFQDGRYQITTAYDPTAVLWNGEVWTATECFGDGFARDGADTASACVAPLDRRRKIIDGARGTVPVLGGSHADGANIGHSASVPKLLVHDGRLYLYWTAVAIDRGAGRWTGRIASRAIELVQESGGARRLWARGSPGRSIKSDHPDTFEVWGPGTAADEDTVADTFQIVSDGTYVYATAALGGQGCVTPLDGATGCYRFVVSRARAPLGHQIFNRNVARNFPYRNGHEYSVFERDASGRLGVLAKFLSTGRRTDDDDRIGNALRWFPLPAPTGAPVATWEESFVRALFRDVVGRPPTTSEEQALLSPASGVAPEPSALVKAVLARPELEELVVAHAYDLVLKRAVENDTSLQAQVQSLRRLGYIGLVQALVGSGEFRTKFGDPAGHPRLTDPARVRDEFLTHSYRLLLGRQPDPAGMTTARTTWDTAGQVNAIRQIWDMLLASDERAARIERENACP